MKIFSGKFKGRNFYMPKDIRPTSNIIRKAFFDILGQTMEDRSFIDICAGSGAMALEALSLESKEVVMVEMEKVNCQVIQENIDLLISSVSISNKISYEIINNNAFSAIKKLHAKKRKFDVAFIDPPYGRGLAKKALNCLVSYDILQPNCVVAIEHEKREVLPESAGRFFRFRQKKCGSTLLSFYQ